MWVALVLPSLATAGAQSLPVPDADTRVRQLVASISEARLRTLVSTLAGFGTRETLSTTSSTTRGIGAARQWIFDELRRSSPRLQVSFETYTLAVQRRITRPTELRNVMAVLPGRTNRRIYLSAHYDSVNLGSQLNLVTTRGATNPQERADFNHDADAPGANDNASGTALTMEVARVLAESGITFDATLVFACWAGEEQGLMGSAAHAKRLVAEKAVVEAVFNNDIVGNVRGGNGRVDAASVRVFSSGPEDSMSRSLARYIARVASVYVPSHRVRLMGREDRFGRSSDHSSFTTSGFPAIVFRESNENFERQHSAADTVDGVDIGYLAQNARVNAAGIASLALAPASPGVTGTTGTSRISRGPSGYDANLQWSASAGAVGYRIYWRETWATDWQQSQTVSNVTQFVLPDVPIDDFVFGVAAIGPSGHESLIRAYLSQPRTPSEIKLVK
jgi:hypothetical protein